MAEEKNADRSSIEIKQLVRKLHPDKGNHKDRIRRLNRFRNYISNKGTTPEFYDDDIPLLFLGSAAPAASLDDPDDVEILAGLYGLLQACGTPSGEHDGTLKRSARHAMTLLKWLLLDWNKNSDAPNPFKTSFLCLNPQQYQYMGLDFHCDDRKGDRGGAKEEACQVIVLILTEHRSEDGEKAQPLMMEELITRPIAQQEFEIWLANSTSASVQEKLRRALGGGVQEDYDDDSDAAESDHEKDDGSEGSDQDYGDSDDIMAAFRKRQKNLRKELKQAEGRGEIRAKQGVAARWEDSQLAREQRAWAASANRAGQHQSVRDSQDAAQEAAEREEVRDKLVGKDPLGLINDQEFDLRQVELNMAEQMEQALHDLQEEIQKAESAGSEELVRTAAAQKESLEALVERMGGLEMMENPQNATHSVLPSHPKFDPLLFLTLVHRKTSYDALMGSMGRLSSKTENQAEQLQNLVRENFPLFVRCAEGFEEFRRNSENEVGMGVHERIGKLEAIAESCAFQAKKSFKPLLDNTSEVRKVQSAISVLHRVAPILQVPSLMRQHLENRRYSQALKTFRRVLVVGDNCQIALLNHVKKQAEQCVLEARRDLELRLAQDTVSIDDLMGGIRDLSDLLELDVPTLPPSSESDLDPTLDGCFDIGGTKIQVRDYHPALSCLLLQAAYFSQGVKQVINNTDDACQRIFADDSDDAKKGNQWKYDVLDARVVATMKAVTLARRWLPRLLAVAQAAREEEKRRAAKGRNSTKTANMTALDVFVRDISPPLKNLVEHATFCAIGSNTRSGAKDVRMTFGQSANEKLHALIRSPLPPSQSTKVGKELADLVTLLSESSGSARALQNNTTSVFTLSLLDDCKSLGDSAVVTIEKRRCIYAFDVCARACSNRASGSGKFDTDTLSQCLKNLSEQLSRPDQCASEVEKGCELVIRRCCEGLASYVRDRGDAARLIAVAECADVLADRLDDVVRESMPLTPNTDTLQEVMREEITGLENVMFDEYLDSIKHTVSKSVKVGWLDKEEEDKEDAFPAYLSASLLAIVRCRAQVEQAVGEKIRKAANLQYQHLAMKTVANGVIEGICDEISKRRMKLRVRQADRLANELDFLRSTLKKFLGEEARELLASTLHMVSSKAGRGRDYQGDGPDGLAGIEELERLGRVYVLCLGD
ncbi:hypothetical protein FisN_22Lh076 [Fistulifera solaris]|uniref:Exocyst complex component n=1 Tax=Fistulifera solaris TaxID=1519565 RepID=A0A1Z5JBM0_FISSO|nr:hypothetical protein FisN_22Lh076 [Fistulifera solaris]|eukprot:GAX11403.1 hypothetical protein FisN_22Lh076 [Fistulifera solaris]